MSEYKLTLKEQSYKLNLLGEFVEYKDDQYQLKSNLVTSVSDSSTDEEYPSAKCVYDIKEEIESSIPTKTSDLSNDSGFISQITYGDVTGALGYTPYNASNPNGYTSNVGTVTSVNNTSPVDGNVSITIPTVNNSTITITQGGVSKGSFTLNQSSGETIALDAGGGSSAGILGYKEINATFSASTLGLVDVSADVEEGKFYLPIAIFSSGNITYMKDFCSFNVNLGTVSVQRKESTTGTIQIKYLYLIPIDSTISGDLVYGITNVGSNTAVWGEITGTLSNQTDLSTALAGKQDTLTAGSNITISSGTISATDTTYSAFTGADGTDAGTSGLVPAPLATDNVKYLKGNGSFSQVAYSEVSGTPSLATVATTGAYSDLSGTPSLSGYQTTANLVTSVDSSSTDSQYPSAKLFYDTVGDIETLINAL